nr:T9SS type A sorting domain-containing protein [Bacteroidota bacterium]
LTNELVPITDVFTSPLTDIFLMYNIQSNQVYWPDGGIFTITDLTPGYAYYLWMNNDATATFPPAACAPLDNVVQPELVANDGPWPLVRTADVHLIALDQSALAGLENVDFIGAFAPDGTCIGYASTARADGNVLLTVYGDDISTTARDGALENELIQLVAYNEFGQTEEVLYVTYDSSMPQSDGLFTTNGISKIVSLTTSTTGINNDGISGLINIYPNPARDEVTIVYPFGKSVSNEVTVELINAEGLLVRKEILTGNHTQIDVSNLRPGVYVLRFESEGLFNVKRLVIQ